MRVADAEEKARLKKIREGGKIIQEDTDHLITEHLMTPEKPAITPTEETEQIIETILEDVVIEIKKENGNEDMD